MIRERGWCCSNYRIQIFKFCSNRCPGFPLKSTGLASNKLTQHVFFGARTKTRFHRFIQVTEKWLRQLRHEHLKEAWSASGWYGCETCLKFKIGNYRAKLSRCGCAEELGNAEERRGAWKERSNPAATSRNPAELKGAHLPEYLKAEKWHGA